MKRLVVVVFGGLGGRRLTLMEKEIGWQIARRKRARLDEFLDRLPLAAGTCP